MTLYHLTWNCHVGSILASGLVPNHTPNNWAVKGARERSVGRLYLCAAGRRDHWWSIYSERCAGEPVRDPVWHELKLVWLEVDATGLPVAPDTGVNQYGFAIYAGDYILTEPVPPHRVRIATPEVSPPMSKPLPPDGTVPEVEPTRAYGTGYGTRNKDHSYTESHPSYGMVRVHRTHCGGGGMRLFGSPIESPTTIRFEVCEATVNRDLSRDWYYARKPLVLIEMSPAQFAELITNFNTEGVPCTLRRVGAETRPDCPQRHVREEIVDEFKGTLKELSVRLREATAAATAILDNKDKKTLTNADRNTLRDALGKVNRFLTDSGPFIHSQFDEAMDKTVNAAKIEFSAAVTTMAHSLGLGEMAARLADASLGGPPALPPAGGTTPIGDGG